MDFSKETKAMLLYILQSKPELIKWCYAHAGYYEGKEKYKGEIVAIRSTFVKTGSGISYSESIDAELFIELSELWFPELVKDQTASD